ncbi:unnamed protein product [Moneuplotes crassus]|uniref:Uncharacterized protein n=1 Tax=Euplotes crassus TaxID=5936 RepID=A0AAD1U7R9_EUPCR|nr:unnamed protein product [Moneuplotes crassus]
MYSKTTKFGTKTVFLPNEYSSDDEQSIVTQASWFNRAHYSDEEKMDATQLKLREAMVERINATRSLSRETPKFPRKKSKTQQSSSLLVKKKAPKNAVKMLSPFAHNRKSTNHKRSNFSIVGTTFEDFLTHDHVSALESFNKSMNSHLYPNSSSENQNISSYSTRMELYKKINELRKAKLNLSADRQSISRNQDSKLQEGTYKFRLPNIKKRFTYKLGKPQKSREQSHRSKTSMYTPPQKDSLAKAFERLNKDLEIVPKSS